MIHSIIDGRSFFLYNTLVPREGSTWPTFAAVNNISFTPRFVSSVSGCDATICGSNAECCFDLAVTGDATFSRATKTAMENDATVYRELQTEPAKLCPYLTAAYLVSVTGGKTRVRHLTSLTFSQIENSEGIFFDRN